MPVIKSYTMNIWKDTYANLASDNQIVSAGMPVYETDTGRIKIGTGARYNSTAYTIGKTTKSLNNDISASNVTITLDAAQIGYRYIISCHSGDGTYKLIVNPAGGDSIKSGNTTLDATAQGRMGEGEMFLIFECFTANVWTMTSYQDKGSNSNGEFEKHIDLSQTCRWLDPVARTTSATDPIYLSYYYSCGAKTFPVVFKAGAIPKFKPLFSANAGGLTTTSTSITATGLNLFLMGANTNNNGHPGYEASGVWA